MAANIKTRYGTRANDPSIDYPSGSFKNKSAPDSVDGTPLERDWANDFLGTRDAILQAAGITANGNIETAQASQVLTALTALFRIPGRSQRFLSGGTFTVPEGVTQIWVSGVAPGGGGGGGGGATNQVGTGAGGCGGGAGQSVLCQSYAVTPGATLTITIGNQGTAGAAGTATTNGGQGGNGGNLSVGSLITLAGGGGGDAGARFAGAGTVPAGGISSSGYPSGSSGSDGATGFNGGVGSGGSGGSSPFGGGGGSGRAGTSGTPGKTAGGYGAGGGGGGGGYGTASAGATGGAGAAGSPGFLLIQW